MFYYYIILFYCFIIILFYYYIILLLFYFIVLFYCFIIILFYYYFIVLFYCFIVVLFIIFLHVEAGLVLVLVREARELIIFILASAAGPMLSGAAVIHRVHSGQVLIGPDVISPNGIYLSCWQKRRERALHRSLH